jgi:hypothetical protein
MVIMVITGIIGMTAGAVVIVVETATAEAVVVVIAEAVAAVETEGQVVAEAVADRRRDRSCMTLLTGEAIEKTNIIYEITRK